VNFNYFLKPRIPSQIENCPLIFNPMFFRLGILAFIFFTISIDSTLAEYEVKGKLNISDDWQYQIFLSTINKLDDYYNPNAEFIIQVGNIDSTGSFTLKGDNLPLESRFYRLYLVKEDNSEFDACRYVDDEDHNFIHIILDNNTKLEILSDRNHSGLFGNYQLIGDQANKSLRDLNMMIFPSFYFHRIKFPSELQFSEQKFNRDLFDFADSSQHVLVSLAAIINTDMDQYFDIESEKYLNFGKRLSVELNNHSYTEDYFRKLNYYNGGLNNESLPAWVYYLIFALFIGLVLAIVKIFNLNKKLEEISKSTKTSTLNPAPSFTKQEEKILALILEEKSNKEIASELFIELSTVKTHINKLYAKMGAKNRSEAKSMAKSLDLAGV